MHRCTEEGGVSKEKVIEGYTGLNSAPDLPGAASKMSLIQQPHSHSLPLQIYAVDACHSGQSLLAADSRSAYE